MSDTTRDTGPTVRASDAEREQTVALLQHNYADGRLTHAELEERAAAAYAAKTRAQLHDLTADLPAAQQPPQSGMVLDQRLLIILLCVHPPAALVYWLLCRRNRPATAGIEPAAALSAQDTDLRSLAPDNGQGNQPSGIGDMHVLPLKRA